jgi:predicted porin
MSTGVAFAQTQYAAPAKPIEFNMATVTFTLYGNFDEYLNYMRSSSGGHLFALEDGAFLRTRLGLKGLKDVGDGYYMKFVLEQGLFSDNGAAGDSTSTSTFGTTGRLFDRQAWVGVDTPYGELRAGRQNTAVFFRGDYIDFTTRTLGSAVNTFGVPSRYDSDLTYISHRIEGFLFEAHYSLAGSVPNDSTRQKVYQLALEYLNGPYRLGYAGVESAGAPPTSAAVGNIHEPNIYYHCFYANYEYSPGSKVYLAFLRSNNNVASGALDNGGAILGNTGNLPTSPTIFNPDHYRIWQVSADYRLIPKLRLGGLYGRIDDTSADNKNANAWVVGGYYDIFRDTMLYGLIDAVVNAHNAGFRPAGSAGLQTQFTAAADVNGQSIRGVQLGVVYKF